MKSLVEFPWKSILKYCECGIKRQKRSEWEILKQHYNRSFQMNFLWRIEYSENIIFCLILLVKFSNEFDFVQFMFFLFYFDRIISKWIKRNKKICWFLLTLIFKRYTYWFSECIICCMTIYLLTRIALRYDYLFGLCFKLKNY